MITRATATARLVHMTANTFFFPHVSRTPFEDSPAGSVAPDSILPLLSPPPISTFLRGVRAKGGDTLDAALAVLVYSDARSDMRSEILSDARSAARSEILSDARSAARSEILSDARSAARSEILSDARSAARSEILSDARSAARSENLSDAKSVVRSATCSGLPSALFTAASHNFALVLCPVEGSAEVGATAVGDDPTSAHCAYTWLIEPPPADRCCELAPPALGLMHTPSPAKIKPPFFTYAVKFFLG
jgi:hypothetical protein